VKVGVGHVSQVCFEAFGKMTSGQNVSAPKEND